ncbi:MAG: hypothetical protein RLZ37_1517, partial [Actinomycetota bacterium]
MQPASSTSPGAKSSSSLKKWGPIAAIVAVVAVVVIVIATSGGGDSGDGDAVTPGDSTADTSAPESTGDGSWSYPLSYPQAEEMGIEDTIEWGERCDTERGRLAVVDFFAPFCMAPFEGDNGGATSTGVTAETITIVHYQGPDNDP